MSIPREHHFVSQVLTRKFLDSEGKVQYYDKVKDIYGKKNSAEGIFFEKDLNTTIGDNGKIDFKSMEDTLNKNFETDFNNHYNKVTIAVEMENYENLAESLRYLIGMGIIGEMRTPWHRTASQDDFIGTMKFIAEQASEELKANIESMIETSANFINASPLNYKDVTDETLKYMGDVIYSILKAPEEDYFILPDCTSAVLRDNLIDDVIVDGERLKSDAQIISTIIYPINSKLMVVAQSSKICPLETHGIFELNSERVYDYNKVLFQRACQRIVCQNKDYLAKFVNKYKSEVVDKK